MPESGVVLPADATGKALRTETVTTTFGTGSGGVVHQQVVSLGDPTTPANLVAVDANGRLQVADTGYSIATPAAVAWTSSSAGATYVVPTSLAGNITFWIYNGGTAFSGTSPVINFEQSADNVNWAPLQVQRSDTGVVLTSITMPVLSAATALAFEAAMEGVAYARARLVTAPGSGIVAVYALSGGGFFEPVVSAMPGTALTKGVQQPQGFATQDLKDSGRAVRSIFTATPVALTATDTALATSTSLNFGTATTSAWTVTGGKTFRIQQMHATFISTAASGYGYVRLRAGSSTTVTNNPVLVSGAVGATQQSTALANQVGQINIDIPDGLEVPGGYTVGVSALGYAATTATAQGLINVTIVGYEY